MKINEVEALVGITKKNIRFYEEKGLLTPRRNSENGYREYEARDVEQLRQIKLLRKLGVPLEEVYGVSTFYSQFTLNPKGKYKVSVCLGTACYVKGSGAIYDALKEKLGIDGGECTPDGKFSLDACRCIGACGLAPVITINDEVYGRLLPEDLDDILAKYE